MYVRGSTRGYLVVRLFALIFLSLKAKNTGNDVKELSGLKEVFLDTLPHIMT